MPKVSIPKSLKIKVWDKNVGENVGKTKCLCCNITDITQLKFHCGHVIAEANGGLTELNNLVPICESCNKSMGTCNLEEFKLLLLGKIDVIKVKKTKKQPTEKKVSKKELLNEKISLIFDNIKKYNTATFPENKEFYIIRDTFDLYFASKKGKAINEYIHELCNNKFTTCLEGTSGGLRRMINTYIEHIPCLLKDVNYIKFLDKRGYIN